MVWIEFEIFLHGMAVQVVAHDLLRGKEIHVVGWWKICCCVGDGMFLLFWYIIDGRLRFAVNNF